MNHSSSIPPGPTTTHMRHFKRCGFCDNGVQYHGDPGDPNTQTYPCSSCGGSTWLEDAATKAKALADRKSKVARMLDF